MTTPDYPLSFREWPNARPEEVGFVGLAERVDSASDSGQLVGLHGLVVARAGRLVLERYYTGRDERLGVPIGEVQFERDTLHDLRSVTKSVVGLLYGIALREDIVPDIDASIVDQFPQYPDLANSPAKRTKSCTSSRRGTNCRGRSSARRWSSLERAHEALS